MVVTNKIRGVDKRDKEEKGGGGIIMIRKSHMHTNILKDGFISEEHLENLEQDGKENKKVGCALKRWLGEHHC